jgi:anti-sigma factor RsiW
MRLSDGEMTHRDRRELNEHLKNCERCRMEVLRLQAAEGDGTPIEAPPVDTALAGIRQWVARRREQDPEARVVKERVAEEITGYLGAQGARRVLEPVTDNAKLLPSVEPVLAIFLGCRAATDLIQHILDVAIVRI